MLVALIKLLEACLVEYIFNTSRYQTRSQSTILEVEFSEK